MATLAEKRAWLRDNTTEDVPARGRLRPDLLQMYDDANPDALDSGFTYDSIPGDPDWDLDDGPDVFADPVDEPVPMTPERAPRTQRAARAERRAQPVTKKASSWLGKLMGEDAKKNAAKAKKPVKRTSLEKLISRGYGELGKMVAPLSRPMSNCLQAQAAFAGLVWEDILRDSIVDKALQPAARAEEKLSKGFALVATPLAVLALEQTMVAVQTEAITVGQGAIRQAFIMPVLREGLRKQLEISDMYADQIAVKLEQDARWDAEVDKLIALIFAQPEPAPEPQPEMAGAAA